MDAEIRSTTRSWRSSRTCTGCFSTSPASSTYTRRAGAAAHSREHAPAAAALRAAPHGRTSCCTRWSGAQLDEAGRSEVAAERERIVHSERAHQRKARRIHEAVV